MNTSNKKIYFPNLNALRFFAAALVLVSHLEETKVLFQLSPNPDGLWWTLEQFTLIGELAVTFFLS